MSGLWKTHITALTLATLLASSHTSFAQEGGFQSSKPVFTFTQTELAKALKNGNEGKLSLRLTIPGWFNDSRQKSSLKSLGLYLDPQDKNRVLYHEEGAAANPTSDPEVTKLHLYANGEYGMTGSFRNFKPSDGGAYQPGSFRPGSYTPGSYTPGSSSSGSVRVMSPADIRLILENDYGIKDKKQLDRLMKLINDYLKSGKGKDLDKIKKALKDMGLDPNLADDLVFRIRNGGGQGAGATGPGRWVWAPQGSSGHDGGGSSGDIVFGQNPNRSAMDDIWAKYGLGSRPRSVNLSFQNGGHSYGLSRGLQPGTVYLMTPDAIRQFLINNGITDPAIINRLIPLIERAQRGDVDAQNELDRELARHIPDAQKRRQFIVSLIGDNSGSERGVRSQTMPGSFSVDRSNVTIPAPAVESILGEPHLLVYEFDADGNLIPVYYKIVDGQKAVDKDGKTIWQKNAQGGWDLVDAAKKSEQDGKRQAAEVLKKIKFIDGFKIKSMFIESGSGNVQSVTTDIPVNDATGQNVDHFLRTSPQTEFLRPPQ